jgi:hypothetical protein
VEELILDFEAYGFLQKVEFADLNGWSLTDRGRARVEELLTTELEESRAREAIATAHAMFLPLNKRFLDAITRWQVRPQPWDDMALNDHTDPEWDGRAQDALIRLTKRLRPVEQRLSAALARFEGYTDRIERALAKVQRGEMEWIDKPGIDSCHMVWFELHEDLIATLGLERGADA